MSDTLLRVEGLQKHFPMFRQTLIRRPTNPVKAVDGISFSLSPGQTLGLVGESGCGKSTAGRTVLRLLEPTGGKIEFEGRDITAASGSELRRLRREMQMVFQDPYGSLNPRQTIGSVIAAPFEIQGITPPGGRRKAVQELMERVGLNPEHYNRFPHEFSGGQRQRIGVARAIALKPKLVVCDEPVSALDVSIQAQVVNLLEDIQAEQNLSYVFIAHDLSVVRHISDRVAVMYLGKIMEEADRDEFYERPRHPYTKALLSAVPVPDPTHRERHNRIVLQGDLPSPANPPSGCVFRTRCWKAQERCATEVPALLEISPGHRIACHFPEPAPVENFERPVSPLEAAELSSAPPPPSMVVDGPALAAHTAQAELAEVTAEERADLENREFEEVRGDRPEFGQNITEHPSVAEVEPLTEEPTKE